MTDHDYDNKFHSLCQELHTNVRSLMKLLADNSSGFELRHTARSIQRLLQNYEFSASFRSTFQSSGAYYPSKLEMCEAVVSDLMSLVTMTTVVCNDANAAELLPSLQHLSLDLLHNLPSFEPTWLEKLLDCILVLMQTSVSSQYSLLSDMVVLFNQHVSCQDEMRVLFAEHRSVFATTCVALSFMKDRQTELPTTESIPIEFAIFVDSLVSFCTICTIEAAPIDTTDAEGNTAMSQTQEGESTNMPNWLHDETPLDFHSVSCELTEEVQMPNTACSMKADAHFYIASLDTYGAHLIELSLLLLEGLNQQAVKSQLDNEGMHTSFRSQDGSDISEASRTQKLGKDETLQVLQYATLATNFLCATSSIPQQASSLRGADRSLLKGLVNFMLHSEGSMSLHSFASESLVGGNETGSDADKARSRKAVVATDALWRLTELHSASHHPEDAPLIVASMFFVWKYAENLMWPTQFASSFLQPETATNPSQTHSMIQDLRGEGKPLHHCLQTLLVAHALFPSQQFPTLPVIELFQCVFSELAGDGGRLLESQQTFRGDGPDVLLGHRANQVREETHTSDPWKSWVFDQISE